MTPTRDRRTTVAVVGGGIAGLVAARTLVRARLRVVVFEADARLGGKIRTDRLEGRVAEAGPDSFLVREPDAERLCADLGVGDLVSPAAFGAHVWWRERLRALPEGYVLGVPASPLAALRSGILSPRGVGRALGDLFMPGPLEGPDISVGALIRRRFGEEVLQRLVDPVLAGTRAGDPDDMSLAAAAPQIDAAARSHRSVLVGLMRAGGSAAARAPRFRAPRAGMGTVVDALSDELAGRADLHLGCAVQAIDRSASGYALRAGTERVLADGVVVAVPAFAAAKLLAPVSRVAARELSGIAYASIALVSLVYPPGAGTLPPTGSGILVPSSERRLIAGCTWTSRKWHHLAPRDGALSLRCFVGRAGNHPGLELDDHQLVRSADGELRAALRLRAGPRASSVVRWRDAIPQYSVGHNARVDRVERALGDQPLALAGAAYRGSGLPECIRQGEAAAHRVLGRLTSGGPAM